MGTTEEDRFDTTEASPWMRPFVPARFLRNAHLQTIVGNLMPRTYSVPEPESQLIDVDPATSHGASFVLCHCHWQPAEVSSQRLTMIIVHGLEVPLLRATFWGTRRAPWQPVATSFA